MGDRMKIHASGEDNLEAVLMLQKEKGMVRSVEPTHGLFKTEYQSCSKRPAGRWFSEDGRGWISPPDRHRPRSGEKNL